MIVIVPFILAHMALGGVEPRGDVAPQLDQIATEEAVTEFGTVLTRLLGKWKELEDGGQAKEEESAPQVPRERKQATSGNSPVAACLHLPLVVQTTRLAETQTEEIKLTETPSPTLPFQPVLPKLPDHGFMEMEAETEIELQGVEPVLPEEAIVQAQQKIAVQKPDVERLDLPEAKEQAQLEPPGQASDMATILPQEQEEAPILAKPEKPPEGSFGQQLRPPNQRRAEGEPKTVLKEVPIATPQEQPSTEVKASSFAEHEVEGVLDDAGLDVPPQPAFAQEVAAKEQFIDESQDPLEVVVNATSEEMVGAIRIDDVPVETHSEGKTEIHPVPVQIETERDQGFDAQQKTFSDQRERTFKDMPKARTTEALSDATTAPADFKAFEPLVESADVETQMRAVLDFEDRENLLPKLVQKIESLVQDERSEVRIELKPEHLGELKIKLSIERGIMVAEFVVQNQAVREVIASQLPQLQTALQDHGGSMADVSVSVGLSHKGPDDEREPRSGQSRQHGQGRLQKASTFGSERAYLGRSAWNQVDVRV